MSERFSENHSSLELGSLIGDCYYTLGCAYLTAGEFGDSGYATNAITMFEQAIDVYKKNLDKNDNIFLKKKISESYRKIASSYMQFCEVHPLEFWIAIDKATKLYEDILTKEYTDENLSRLLRCYTQGIFVPLLDEFYSEGAIREEHKNKIDKLNSIENWLKSNQKNFECTFELESTLLLLYRVMTFLYLFSNAPKNFEKAKKYIDKSLNLLSRNRKNFTLYSFEENFASILFVAGILNEKLDNIDKAIECIRQSLEKIKFLSCNNVNDQSGLLTVEYFYLGVLFSEHKRDYFESRTYFKRAIENASEQFNICGVCDYIIEDLNIEVKELDEKILALDSPDEIVKLNTLKKQLLTELNYYNKLMKNDVGYKNYVDWKENGGEIKQMLFK